MVTPILNASAAIKGMPDEKGDTPDLTEWVSNQPYVPRNLIAVVTRNITPFGEHGEIFSQMVKAVLELHAISIKGLTTGFEFDTNYTSYPEIQTVEKYGRPIDQMLMHWRKHYTTVASKPAGLRTPEELLMAWDNVTVDVMFIEPDPTHTAVVAAWHGVNMYPDTYGGIESKRDLNRRYPVSPVEGFRLRRQPKPVINKFTLGYESMNTGVDVLKAAQAVLDGISLAAANPYAPNEFVKHISDDVLAQLNN